MSPEKCDKQIKNIAQKQKYRNRPNVNIVIVKLLLARSESFPAFFSNENKYYTVVLSEQEKNIIIS